MHERIHLQRGSLASRALRNRASQIPWAPSTLLRSDPKPPGSINPNSQHRTSTLWMREPDSVLRKKLGLPPKPLDVEEDDEYESWKLDPYHQQPEGLTLVRRLGLLAISQMERRNWIYNLETGELDKSPDLETWKKYRGPPGKPADDDAAIDALPEMRALRAKYDQACEEERLAQQEREKQGDYLKDGNDPFSKVVYLQDLKSNWDGLRSPGLFAAAARTEDHKQAFIDKGWLKLRDLELEAMEEREGIVVSELERKRRDAQWAADWADTEYDWEERIDREMEAWKALEMELNGSSSSA